MSRLDEKIIAAGLAAAAQPREPEPIHPMLVIDVTNNDTGEVQHFHAETYAALRLGDIAMALFQIGALLAERLPLPTGDAVDENGDIDMHTTHDDDPEIADQDPGLD